MAVSWGRRAFLASAPGAAAACRSGGFSETTSAPDPGPRYSRELAAALHRLPELELHSQAAAPEQRSAAEAADRRLQGIMHALLVSGTERDLGPLQQHDPTFSQLREQSAPIINEALILSLWDAEDMLDDPEDSVLAALDEDPSALLDAAQEIDELAARAGLPKRWRRRLQRGAENLAWRIRRQSARAVVGEAVDRSHRAMRGHLASNEDPIVQLIRSDDWKDLPPASIATTSAPTDEEETAAQPKPPSSRARGEVENYIAYTPRDFSPYIGIRIAVQTRDGRVETGILLKQTTNKLLLLTDSVHRKRVSRWEIANVRIGTEDRRLVAEAYARAHRMTVIGAIFTGTLIFMTCLGLPLLIVGLVRLRQLDGIVVPSYLDAPA